MLVIAMVIVFGAPVATAAAAPVATPGELAFTDHLGGPASAPQTVTLTNTGDTPLFVQHVTVTGSGFTVTDDSCSGAAIFGADDQNPPNGSIASCTVSVAFAAANPGGVTGELRFETTANPDKVVDLTGIGTGPRAVVNPAQGRSFSAVVGTSSPSQRVTLTNTGNEPLEGIGVAVVGGNFTVVTDTCSATTLSTTGASCAVDVAFVPTAAATYAAALRFTSNDPVRPAIDVPLSGTGIAAGPVAPGPPGDVDGDGVPDAIDTCRTVAGNLTNGCPSDRDKDGVPDGADTCKATPGDLRNGCPSELNADIRGRWRVNKLLSQLLSLTVRAPKGSRIEVRCSGRPGVCDFSRRVVTKTTRRTTGLTRYFRGRRILPARTTITVRVTRTQQIGSYKRMVTRSRLQLPKVTERCIRPGTGTVQRCP